LRGVQLGGITYVKKDFYGLQAGLLNVAGNSCGVQLAAGGNAGDDFRGLQIGAMGNKMRKISGIQIGAVNITEHVRGAQIGIFNMCRTLRGIQIGLINKASDNFLKYMPVVNVGWYGK